MTTNQKGSTMPFPTDRVLFGAAYYHEYQPTERLDADMDLMARPTSPSSGWANPSGPPGSRRTACFDLDWLQPVLDAAHERGIQVDPRHARPTRCRRGWPAPTRRSTSTAPRASRWAGASARRSTTPTRRSCSTPSGSSARSSPGTPTTRPSSASRWTTSPATRSSTTAASSSASSTTCARSTAPWRSSTASGA